jgi:hypothetical protein
MKNLLRQMNKNIIFTTIYKEIYENVNMEYWNMNIISYNITQMGSCAEILNLKSKFGKGQGVPCEIEVKMYSNGILCENMK